MSQAIEKSTKITAHDLLRVQKASIISQRKCFFIDTPWVATIYLLLVIEFRVFAWDF